MNWLQYAYRAVGIGAKELPEPNFRVMSLQKKSVTDAVRLYRAQAGCSFEQAIEKLVMNPSKEIN